MYDLLTEACQIISSQNSFLNDTGSTGIIDKTSIACYDTIIGKKISAKY